MMRGRHVGSRYCYGVILQIGSGCGCVGIYYTVIDIYIYIDIYISLCIAHGDDVTFYEKTRRH